MKALSPGNGVHGFCSGDSAAAIASSDPETKILPEEVVEFFVSSPWFGACEYAGVEREAFLSEEGVEVTETRFSSE